MPRGPKPTPITLTADERAKLTDWALRPTSAQRLALRARIALAAASGRASATIAADLRVTVPTVRKWRERFSERRLAGLADEPRPGTPRTITDEHVEAAVTRTLESKPTDATHGSTRTLARDLGLSQTAVVRIWHAFGLKPHRRSSFKLSTDPFFVERVRDVGIGALHPDGLGASPRRKPRGMDRPPEDRNDNRMFGRGRIVVEHAIGRLRRFRAVAHVNRHRRKGHAARVRVIARWVNRMLDHRTAC